MSEMLIGRVVGLKNDAYGSTLVCVCVVIAYWGAQQHRTPQLRTAEKQNYD